MWHAPHINMKLEILHFTMSSKTCFSYQRLSFSASNNHNFGDMEDGKPLALVIQLEKTPPPSIAKQ